MNKFFKASKYGKSDKEMRIGQRSAHSKNNMSSCKGSCSIPKRDYTEERNSNLVKQFGFESCRINSDIFQLLKFSNINISDELVTQIEGVVALFFTLSGCEDQVAMTSAIFLYVRKFMSKSATSVVMAYVVEILEFSPQSDGENGDWLDILRNLRDNWTLVRDNKLFSHFSKLLGLLVTMQLCTESQLTFSIKEYKIWEPDMRVVHGSAIDIFDAALNTVAFFVESMSLCWRDKSLRPLLVNDRAATELDEEYANLVLWWDLVKNGNLKRVVGISEKEFDRRLETLITKLRNMVNGLKSFDKRIINDKFMRLLRIKNDYITMKISCGVRRSPYCVELFGASSQGKTTFGEQIIQALLVSAGLPTGKEYQASYNASDKFMSTWSTDKTVLLIDDMANDKSNFVERPPTRVIIDVCNNQPFYANMADLDSKGKVFVEPELCIVTTNVKDLDARVYSNCPYSIQRRMHVVITVEAKPEFQFSIEGKPQGIDPAKVAAYNKKNPNMMFDDIWHLTLEKAICPKSLTVSAKYAPILWKGKKLEKISFAEAVEYLIEDYHKHSISQDNILERMKKRNDMKICGIDGCKHIQGLCKRHPLEKHFGDEIVNSTRRAYDIVASRVSRDLFGLDRGIEGLCTYALMTSAKTFARHWDWMNIVPTPWIHNKVFKNTLMLIDRDVLKRRYVGYSCALWMGILGTIGYRASSTKTTQGNLFNLSFGTGLLAMGFSVQKSMVHIVKRQYMRQLVDRNTIAPLFKKWRDEHVSNICKASVIVGGLYAISKVYRAWRNNKPHGSLEPKTIEEIEERDSEENVWTKVCVRDLPVEGKAATSTPEQLRGLIAKNLVYGSVHLDSGRTLMVNGLFLTSNIVVIPHHYFEQEDISITFRKKDPNKSGGKFASRLSLNQSVRLQDTDLRICYSATGGSFKNLLKYLPTSAISQVEFALQWRNKEGVLLEADGLAHPEMTSNGVCDFEGLVYSSLTIDTFKGMCGAILTSKRRPLILGLHLGGRTGTPKGCAGVFQKGIVEDAISKLKSMEGVLISGSSEKFEAQVLGVTVLGNKGLHRKSPLNYMPKDAQVEYYGNCPGMSTFRSNVAVTKISHLVTEITGDANIYGPPVVEPQYYGWQKCLESLAVPAHPYPPSLLREAILDYKSDLLPIFRSNLWSSTKPLSDTENLNGIDGKKFIDPIPLQTSIGYPLSGPKRNFVLEEVDGLPGTRRFERTIMNEINRCFDCYRRGERAFTIAKACKKDEVLSKPKCRIFYGSPISLTFLVRRYFLPILRVLQFNPKVSECAVGINAHGPEWNEMHNHVLYYGKDRIVGGDYGNYDQKIPSQVLFAALRIMIDFAKECDYTCQDIKVMEAMAGDIVYAVVAYNGDLIGVTEGTHISGNSLTVVINCIVCSLNLRCYFKEKHPTKSFREYVKIMTYGDDNIGTVSPLIEDFTIRGLSEFLSQYGQIYTMPDKTSELTDFLPYEEFEFLKRKSNYIPEIEHFVGALVDKSCHKMLHCYVRDKNSPLTEDHACAINIDTALREWFNHGKEKYEVKREQMREVAHRAGITHLCSHLDVTYDECVNNWKNKYFK